ncbi:MULTISPECIES: hypothetical protein [unclassified Crossiella]|uniref:hypothetical protein n=1 Tax=unclassified Crossiella TaxID=2620835 RepID=UPI002494D6B4|nr:MULTISPECIES: hypothetical protein [unclassified Crossiella]
MPRPNAFDGKTIYEFFHKDAKGAEATTDPNYEAWQKLGDRYLTVRDMVENALKAGKVAWEGQAADQAQLVASPLAAWAGAAKTVCTDTAYKVASQSGDFRSVKDKVELPPDPGEEPWLNGAAFWETDYDEAKRVQGEKTNANQQALLEYKAQSETNTTNMPQFIPPPPVTPETSTGNPNEVDPGKRDPNSNVGRIGGGDRNGSGTPNMPNLPPPGSDGRPPGGNDQLDPSWNKPPVEPPKPPPFTPPPLTPPPGPNPPMPPPIGGWPPGQGPNTGPGRGPGGGGGTPPRMPGMPGGGSGRGGGGAGGFGPRGGGFGPSGGGFGPGGSGGVGADGHGPGGGRGGAAGGAGGRGGMGAGGGMGGGGAKGDEDKEHKRPSYLVESDDIWGDNTLVAPPVIGETPPGYR